jgi:hypothetical protein
VLQLYRVVRELEMSQAKELEGVRRSEQDQNGLCAAYRGNRLM